MRDETSKRNGVDVRGVVSTVIDIWRLLNILKDKVSKSQLTEFASLRLLSPCWAHELSSSPQRCPQRFAIEMLQLLMQSCKNSNHHLLSMICGLVQPDSNRCVHSTDNHIVWCQVPQQQPFDRPEKERWLYMTITWTDLRLELHHSSEYSAVKSIHALELAQMSRFCFCQLATQIATSLCAACPVVGSGIPGECSSPPWR